MWVLVMMFTRSMLILFVRLLAVLCQAAIGKAVAHGMAVRWLLAGCWLGLHGNVSDAMRLHGLLHFIGKRSGLGDCPIGGNDHMAGKGVFFAGNRPSV